MSTSTVVTDVLCMLCLAGKTATTALLMAVRNKSELAATLRGSRPGPGVQSASLIMTSLMSYPMVKTASLYTTTFGKPEITSFMTS